MAHIQRKNPFFDGSDLEVNLTYDPKLFFSLLDYFLISDHRAFSLKLVR